MERQNMRIPSQSVRLGFPAGPSPATGFLHIYFRYFHWVISTTDEIEGHCILLGSCQHNAPTFSSLDFSFCAWLRVLHGKQIGCILPLTEQLPEFSSGEASSCACMKVHSVYQEKHNRHIPDTQRSPLFSSLILSRNLCSLIYVNLLEHTQWQCWCFVLKGTQRIQFLS